MQRDRIEMNYPNQVKWQAQNRVMPKDMGFRIKTGMSDPSNSTFYLCGLEQIILMLLSFDLLI